MVCFNIKYFSVIISVSRNSLSELFPLFFSNLKDSIPSVRQGGAVAIANIVKAYGKWGCVGCSGEIIINYLKGLVPSCE